MNAIETYRANAAAQRAAAARTNLQNRREMHERAASVWDGMAENAEETLSKTAINLAAKGHTG